MQVRIKQRLDCGLVILLYVYSSNCHLICYSERVCLTKIVRNRIKYDKRPKLEGYIFK